MQILLYQWRMPIIESGHSILFANILDSRTSVMNAESIVFSIFVIPVLLILELIY